MAPHLTLTSLLLVFAAGMTAQVHAADQQASTLSREACALVRHDIDAVSARIREAMAEHAKVPMRAADYETLAVGTGFALRSLAYEPAHCRDAASASKCAAERYA